MAAFKATRMREKADFIAAKDRSFRPVNMVTGPDGALYLMDMYRAVIEHPEWIPDELEKELDLTAGMDKGRIYKITPKKNWTPAQPVLDFSNPQSLVDALYDKNQWTRMTAQRLMVESEDKKYVPLLEKVLANNENDLAVLHALWTLEGLNSLKTSAIIKAFDQTTAGLIVNALKIAETRMNAHPDLIPPIIALTANENAQVRMRAALTLSRLNEVNYRPHQAAISEAILTMLQHNEIDIWTSLAVASAAEKQAVYFATHLLTSNTAINEDQQRVLLTLARFIGAAHPTKASQALLVALSNNEMIVPTQKSEFIEALANGRKKHPIAAKEGQKIVSVLAKMEAEKHPSVIRACGNLRRVMKLPLSKNTKQQIAAAMQEVKDVSLSVEKRMDLLQLIELEDFGQRSSVLYDLLDNREPLALQEESLLQLWRANSPTVGPKLVELWQGLGPDARKKASDILLYKAFNHEVLLSALETGKINMGEMNFDLERRRTLLWWSETDAVKRRAKQLFSDAGVVTRKAAIEKMSPALTLAGDIAKGKEQFRNLCAQCHRYENLGKNVGPVLTEISRKSKAALLHDILDPNAAVDTKYMNHQTKTKDGNIYTGIIAQESDTEIILKMLGGQETSISKKEIEQLSSLGISMMPEGQERNMSVQDMADLLAFLQ